MRESSEQRQRRLRIAKALLKIFAMPYDADAADQRNANFESLAVELAQLTLGKPKGDANATRTT